jgi:hypothetical protein
MTNRWKKSETKKAKTNEDSSNFISIKNISGKPEWLKLRIGDLIKQINQKKRVSKADQTPLFIPDLGLSFHKS